jgi:hypothetical protein
MTQAADGRRIARRPIISDTVDRAAARLARLRDGEIGDPLRRLPWHWPALCFWAACWFNVMIVRTRQGRGWTPSWHFSATGARLLFGGSSRAGGGMALFAAHPNLQSGPLTFILAEPITWLGPHHGLYAAQMIMMALGLVLLFALERAAFVHRPDVTVGRIRWTMLGGGLALLPIWAMASVYWGHFDDVLALLFSALAVWALAAGRPMSVGLCLAAAVDSKPWAAGFLALLLAIPGGWSRHAPRLHSPRLRALGLVLALIGVFWLPFVLADPHTLTSLSQFSIPNTGNSALRALGVDNRGTPRWDRGAQMLFGCLLGALAVWRRRWPAVLLLGVCARLILEPNNYPYYFAGLIVGALVWDLLEAERPSPIFTVSVTAIIFALVPLAGTPSLQGVVKLWGLIAMAVAALVAPTARSWSGRSGLGGRELSGRLPKARTQSAQSVSKPVPDAAPLPGVRFHDLGGELGGHRVMAQVPAGEQTGAVR